MKQLTLILALLIPVSLQAKDPTCLGTFVDKIAYAQLRMENTAGEFLELQCKSGKYGQFNAYWIFDCGGFEYWAWVHVSRQDQSCQANNNSEGTCDGYGPYGHNMTPAFRIADKAEFREALKELKTFCREYEYEPSPP